MNQRTLYVRVGALLAGSVAMLVVLIVALTGDRWHPGVQYESYFKESVQGLEIGAPVKYRGVTLGHVTKIGLVAAEYGRPETTSLMSQTFYQLIVVRYKINPKLIGKLPDSNSIVSDGLRIKLANQGLTGVMYLELDFVKPESNPVLPLPWTPLDDYIPSVPSTIAQVQDQVTQVLDRINRIDFPAIASNVDGLVSDLRHEVSGQGDLHDTLAKAQGVLEDLRAQVKTADLAALSAQLQKTGAAVETLAQGKQTRALLDAAREDLKRLPKLIDSLQETADRAGGGVADIQSELIPILQDVRAAVQNLRETTEAIRRDPGSVLLQGPPPREPAK
jgi:ABC-type transporter Mla subunit MlaD